MTVRFAPGGGGVRDAVHAGRPKALFECAIRPDAVRGAFSGTMAED